VVHEKQARKASSSSENIDRSALELGRIRDDEARLRSSLEKERVRLSKVLSENKRLEENLKSASDEIEKRKREMDRLRHETKMRVVQNLTTTYHGGDAVVKTVDTTHKESKEHQFQNDAEPTVAEDWSVGPFTKSQIVKKATMFGDGSLRAVRGFSLSLSLIHTHTLTPIYSTQYILTSNQVPQDITPVKSTIWHGTASMLSTMEKDDLNDMFRNLFKDFDEMFTPLSISERRERRQYRKNSSKKDSSKHTAAPSAKSRRIGRVKIRAYENRIPLIENNTSERKEIHESDKTRLHMGFIRLYRLILTWKHDHDSSRKNWASHIITAIVRIRSSLKPPYREEQKKHLKTMLRLMLKSFRYIRHRTSYSDRKAPIFRLGQALRTRNDGHLCRECFEILSRWFDDSSFQDDQGKTVYNGVSFSFPFGGLKSGDVGYVQDFYSEMVSALFSLSLSLSLSLFLFQNST